MDTGKNTVRGFKVDTEEDVKILTDGFAKENEELFLMLGQRLAEYSSAGNFLFLNWLSQAVVNMLKDANSKCEEKVLGIDKSKMQ